MYGQDTISPKSFGSQEVLIVGCGQGAFLSGRDTKGGVEIRHSDRMCGGGARQRQACVLERVRQVESAKSNIGAFRQAPIDAVSISDNASVAGEKLARLGPQKLIMIAQPRAIGT